MFNFIFLILRFAFNLFAPKPRGLLLLSVVTKARFWFCVKGRSGAQFSAITTYNFYAFSLIKISA